MNNMQYKNKGNKNLIKKKRTYDFSKGNKSLLRQVKRGEYRKREVKGKK